MKQISQKNFDSPISLGQLLHKTVDVISADKPEWTRFLCTTAANEEHMLVNQLLIFAQEPYVDCCGTMQELSMRMVSRPCKLAAFPICRKRKRRRCVRQPAVH